MFRKISLALLFPAIAFATPTRVVSLGDQNFFIEDESNVFLFPAAVSRNGQYFSLDLASNIAPNGTTAGPVAGAPPATTSQLSQLQQTAGGGAFLRMGQKLTLGVWTSDYTDSTVGNFFTSVSHFPADANKGKFETLATLAGLATGSPERKYDVFASYLLGETLAGAVHLSYGSDGATAVDTKAKRDPDSFTAREVRLSMGLSSGGKDDDGFDTKLEIQHFGADYTLDGQSQFVNGTLGLGNGADLTARYRMKVSPYWTFVPGFKYAVQSFSLREDSLLGPFGSPKHTDLPAAEARDHSMTNHTLVFLAGGKLKATDRVNFWGSVGVGFAYSGASAKINLKNGGPTNNVTLGESTWIWMAPSVRMGLEAQLNDWLVFRGGVRKDVLYKSGDKSLDDPNTSGNSKDAQTFGDLGINEGVAGWAGFVGFGVKYSGLVADLLFDPQFFFRGPNFVSGASGNLATRATLSYAF